LPRVLRTAGQWIGKARGMANQFRSGVDQMVRESEIADLEKKWREQNEAIMKANPLAPDSGWGLASPPAPAVSLDKPGEAVMLEKPVLLDKPDFATLPEPKKRGPAAPAPISAAYPVPRSDEGAT
jgi:sec-independent protein translocase protein TatB